MELKIGNRGLCDAAECSASTGAEGVGRVEWWCRGVRGGRGSSGATVEGEGEEEEEEEEED
jgi:hypothetical protein